MKRYLVVLIGGLTLFVVGTVYGKDKSTLKGGLGFLSIKGTYADFSPVNKALEVKGFPKAGSGMCVDIGGSGYFQIGKNLVIGIKGGGLCGFVSNDDDRYEVSVEGGYIVTGLGYIKPLGKNLLIADAGIGYGGIVVDVKDKTSRTGDFYTHYIAESAGLLGEISFIFGRWLKEGFFMGIKAGIMYPLSGMAIEGEKINGMYNVGVVIGGGYLNR